MARHKINTEWTLASTRTPRSNRKAVEEALFPKKDQTANRISKNKFKKPKKPSKNTVVKGSWDHTADDSSQIAEGDGINDSEDGSDDSADETYVKGLALNPKGRSKMNKQHTKSVTPTNRKKTHSAGPVNKKRKLYHASSISSSATLDHGFARPKIPANRRRKSDSPDDTPLIARSKHANRYGQMRREATFASPIESESEYSSFTLDMELDTQEGEEMLNEYNLMISDTEQSVSSFHDGLTDVPSLSDSDEFDDLDDESILDEETNFMENGDHEPVLDAASWIQEAEGKHSSTPFSDSEEEEEIYMEMDDPAVQAIINHTSTAVDDQWSDGFMETYFSDEVSGYDGDSDSDVTIIDDEPLETFEPPPMPLHRQALCPPGKQFHPVLGKFKPERNKMVCLIEWAAGKNYLIVMTLEEYYRKGRLSRSSTSVTTPAAHGKASEELFAYLPSEHTQSVLTLDNDSNFDFEKFGLDSEWDGSSAVLDASAFPNWDEYINEFNALSDDWVFLDQPSEAEGERRGSEQSTIPNFTIPVVPVTAFRANQEKHQAMTRNNVLHGVQNSGIKKNAPRKDSSLTPSQRRKSDATHPSRNKTQSPPIPFPIPLEPLFDGAGIALPGSAAVVQPGPTA